MKLQWLIQSRYTQLVLSQVVYLNYRNEHIWPPIRKWLQILEAFHLAFAQIITFDHFLTIHLILRLVLEIFDISILRVSFWLFEHHTFQFEKSFFLFPNQILVCATAFEAHNLFFILRFTFGELYCKNIKIKWEEILAQVYASIKTIKTIDQSYMTSLKIYLQ